MQKEELQVIEQELFDLLKTKGLSHSECRDVLSEVRSRCDKQIEHFYDTMRNTIIK